MNWKETINDRLVNTLDKYSLPGQSVGTDLVLMMDHSKNQELIVPVLGMQGMGKSTLINAILKEDIMPSEADETTCAPVEVKYGEDEKAEVFFSNADSALVIHSKNELYEYVDNNANPGNEKQVSRIVLYRNNDLLKGGLTIVDLPGVGSLTRANEETTRRYVLGLCTAIFVIQGAIRRTEAMFVKSVWAQFPTALFVQNRWVSDTDLEIDECISYNIMRLKQVAEQLSNSFDEHIIVVNAYDGIVGALQNDPSLLKSSNISELIERLEQFANNWTERLETDLYKKFINSITFIQKRIFKKLSDVSKDQERREEERNRIIADFQEESARIDELLNIVTEELNNEKADALKDVSQKTKEYGGKIRAEIHRIIDSGTTDGYQLTEAFSHVQEVQGEILFEEIFEIITKLKLDFEEKVERFGQVIDIDESFGPDYASFYKKESFKFEKVAGKVVDFAGAYGGYLAMGATSTAVSAAIAAAAEAGKISASIGAFAGPIGAAVGILAGVAVGTATFFIVKKGKKAVMKGRGRKTKREMDGAISESESLIKKPLLSKMEEFFKKAELALDAIREMRKEQHENLLRDLETPIDSSQLSVIEEDLSYVSGIIDLFK